MHPFIVASTLSGVAFAMFYLNSLHPEWMPVLMAASLVFLAVRLWQLYLRALRARRASAVIDFAALQGKDLARYEDWLKENVRGHDEAVSTVVHRVQQGLSLAGKHRTLGAFLLVGPTGTGKTFLAELLGKALYPDSAPVVLRMSRYKEAEDIDSVLGSRLLRTPGGLTAPVTDNPYRVVILEELELSNADVQNAVHDIIETGKARDRGTGLVAHFNACAIFATCTSGVNEVRPAWAKGERDPKRKTALRDAMASAGFDRGLAARFDEILFMDELPPLHVAEIVALQLAKHWRQHGIEVTNVAPEVLMEAVKRNAEFKDFGVRQLSRLIQDLTDSTLAEARRRGVREVKLGINRSTGKITIV